MYGGFTPGGTHYSTGAYGAPPTGAYNAAAVSNAYAAGAVAAAPYFSTPGYASAYQTQTAASGTPTTAFSSRVDTFASPTAPVRSTTSSYTTGVTRGASNSVGMPRMPSSNAGSPVRTNVTVTNLTTGGTGGTSTYTGYDAAVYAAATSYLQSKATGGSGTWLGLRKSGGTGGTRGSFPNKSRGGFGGSGGGGGGQQQLHYCEVCKISCAGPQTYREHLEGQRHKKKEALLKGSAQQPLAKSKVSFRCDLCQVTCTGQDTYNAHVRGQKHLKTLKLHQTLGKPIPSNEPTMIAPSQPPPMPAGATGAGAAGAKKVIGVPQMSFVGGQKLTTTATGQPVEVSSPTSAAAANDAMQAALLAEQNVQPVGDDYVEPIKDHTGKLVQYFCKLCDCKFNDLNAKDMHLKGRRHRLQFKKKVNPDLEVEMKPNTMTMRMRRATDERQRKEMMRMRQQEMWSMRGMYPNAPTPLFGGNAGMPKPLFGGPHDGRTGQRGETNDDRHVMAKHAAIYPTEDQISSVQKLVNDTEKALKAVSDHYAELEKSASEAKTTTPAAAAAAAMEDDTASADGVAALKLGDSEKKEEKPKPADERLLKGVMRVGLLAKGLLLRGDTTVNLVVLCSELPTRSLLADIGDLLPKELANVTEEQYDVSVKPEESCLVVKSKTEPVIECFVTLTSVLMRELVAEGDATTTRDSGTLLPAHFCLQALAELRHAKWFQARCSNLQSCLVTLRIMRDICQRIPTWGPLSIWATELLIEKVLTSCGMPLSPGDALRRVFEAVAAGVLLPNGPGLLDPCEKDVMDALTGLTPQQREDITSSAQHALRLIAFNQLYKILAIDRLPDRRVERKRPRDSNGSSDEGRLMNGNKKDKKEENGVEMADASATPQMAAA